MTMPSSAALTDVPSGTARLMPSFCSPFGLAPKPAMMRPRTGQRNDGIAPAASAVLVTLRRSDVRAWRHVRFRAARWRTSRPERVRGCATCGGVRRRLRAAHARNDDAVADLIMAYGWMLLARAKAMTETPCLRAMPISVSPSSTICTFSETRGVNDGLRRRRMACAGRHVFRNDHALAGAQRSAFAEAVRFHDGGCRHAVFARQAVDRVAVRDRDRLTAVPGPMPARRGRRRAMRAHRSGDVGGAGPVSAQALRAGGDALRRSDGGRTARRRQRLLFNAAIGRARGDRTGRLLRRRAAAAGVRIGVKACAVRTTGDGNADQGEDGNVRPKVRACTRARRHVMGRHVVSHSYATKLASK